MLRDLASRWLDVRPDEIRPVALSFAGAFLVLGFVVLARSLREALYLTTFPVETLPYVMAAVAALSVPTVSAFGRLLEGSSPRRVLAAVLVVLAAGLAALLPAAGRSPAAAVGFYLWTALGTLLLTSGFWIVVSELFPVRGAKRLYGLVGAGGTLGVLIVGTGLTRVADRLPISWLGASLVLLLALFYVVQRALPAPSHGTRGTSPTGRDDRSPLAEIAEDPHLGSIALVVAVATVAATLLDYQFKELAAAAHPTEAGLAGFFGAFYGWTAAASLLLQLFVASRLMSSAGLGATLAVLPLLLLAGAVGLVLAPGLALATLVRGTDQALRKSLHRSALEVLFLPLPSDVRRRTKTFVDSVVDSAAEGIGAALIFVWVTWAGLPSRWLALGVALLAGGFLALTRRLDRRYLTAVTDTLRRRAAGAGEAVTRGSLLSATFTRVDLSTGRVEAEDRALDVRRGGPSPGVAAADAGPPGAAGAPDPLSADDETALRALSRSRDWTADDVPRLARCLARDRLASRAQVALAGVGGAAVAHLSTLLLDPGADFVIRRRIPGVLARIDGTEAADALARALRADRFEIRYRAGRALSTRRSRGRAAPSGGGRDAFWAAVRFEVRRERPVWELQRLLDDRGRPADDLVAGRAGVRGELSLEHTFRLLSLLLDPDAVRAAFRGVTGDDPHLASLALEYLEMVLPADVQERLWPFIGDLGPRDRRDARRSIDRVVEELVTTDATLFASRTEQEALRRLARGERCGDGEERGPEDS